jgi:hypothetical protein
MTEIKQGEPVLPKEKPLEAKPSDNKPVLEHGARGNATKPGVPRTSDNFGEPKWFT